MVFKNEQKTGGAAAEFAEKHTSKQVRLRKGFS